MYLHAFYVVLVVAAFAATELTVHDQTINIFCGTRRRAVESSGSWLNVFGKLQKSDWKHDLHICITALGCTTYILLVAFCGGQSSLLPQWILDSCSLFLPPSLSNWETENSEWDNNIFLGEDTRRASTGGRPRPDRTPAALGPAKRADFMPLPIMPVKHVVLFAQSPPGVGSSWRQARLGLGRGGHAAGGRRGAVRARCAPSLRGPAHSLLLSF